MFYYSRFINDLNNNLRTNSNDLDGTEAECFAFNPRSPYVISDRFADPLAIRGL
jgi:hypothetical protein